MTTFVYWRDDLTARTPRLSGDTCATLCRNWPLDLSISNGMRAVEMLLQYISDLGQVEHLTIGNMFGGSLSDRNLIGDPWRDPDSEILWIDRAAALVQILTGACPRLRSVAFDHPPKGMLTINRRSDTFKDFVRKHVLWPLHIERPDVSVSWYGIEDNPGTPYHAPVVWWWSGACNLLQGGHPWLRAVGQPGGQEEAPKVEFRDFLAWCLMAQQSGVRYATVWYNPDTWTPSTERLTATAIDIAKGRPVELSAPGDSAFFDLLEAVSRGDFGEVLNILANGDWA